MHGLTVWKSAENSKSNALKSDKTNQVLTDSFVVLSTTNSIKKSISQQNSEVLSDIINKNVSISFRIQIHQNANLNLIDQVVARYSDVWLKTEWVVNILKKYWMQIHLKNNWKIIDAKLKHKSYSMSVNKHAVINKILDKLHDQKKTYWIQSLILYACSVFIAWQTMYKDEKLI